jgi:hypothetical protein
MISYVLGQELTRIIHVHSRLITLLSIRFNDGPDHLDTASQQIGVDIVVELRALTPVVFGTAADPFEVLAGAVGGWGKAAFLQSSIT